MRLRATATATLYTGPKNRGKPPRYFARRFYDPAWYPATRALAIARAPSGAARWPRSRAALSPRFAHKNYVNCKQPARYRRRLVGGVSVQRERERERG